MKWMFILTLAVTTLRLNGWTTVSEFEIAAAHALTNGILGTDPSGVRKRLNRREWGETRQDAPQPPCVAPEPTAASTVAQPAPRAPAAPVAQPGAKGRKLAFVQTEFWE